MELQLCEWRDMFVNWNLYTCVCNDQWCSSFLCASRDWICDGKQVHGHSNFQQNAHVTHETHPPKVLGKVWKPTICSHDNCPYKCLGQWSRILGTCPTLVSSLFCNGSKCATVTQLHSSNFKKGMANLYIHMNLVTPTGCKYKMWTMFDSSIYDCQNKMENTSLVCRPCYFGNIQCKKS